MKLFNIHHIYKNSRQNDGKFVYNYQRQSAYKWLSKELGIEPEYTHIGMFNADQCTKVTWLSKAKLELV